MKIYFNKKKPEDYIGSKKIFNFFNFHNIWWIYNEEIYRKNISYENNLYFPDGKNVARLLGIKQQRGPSFTRRFLISKISKNKKHFFIGDVDLNKISNIVNIEEKNLAFYNPSYIKNIIFPDDEKIKILKMLNKQQTDCVWVCVGSPKQEILANELYEKYKADYFSVGTALDFLLKKKPEVPEAWSNLGVEWFYRLITDFKYSRRKVWRSFIALNYLKCISVKK